MRGGSSQGEVGVLEKGSVECAQERGKGFEVKEENAIGEGDGGLGWHELSIKSNDNNGQGWHELSIKSNDDNG